MVNISEQIKNLVKKSPKPMAVSSSSINPHKHWKIILWVFLFVVAMLILFSLYLLYKIKNDEIFQVAPSTSDNTSLLKEDLLKKVNASFEEKANKERELKSNPPYYGDPSI